MKRIALVLATLAVAACSHHGDDREQELAQQVSDLQQENDDLRTKLQAAETRAEQAEQGESIASSRNVARVAPSSTDDTDDADGDPSEDASHHGPPLSAAERAAQAASDAAENDGSSH